MVINAIRGGLRRFAGYFVTYRWELWLFIGIWMVLRYVALAFLWPFLYNVSPFGQVMGTHGAETGLFTGLVMLTVMSVSYLRVRRLERDFLPTLWAYLTVVELIGVATAIAVLVVAYSDPSSYFFGHGPVVLIIRLVSWLPLFGAFLWFARRLTRVSLKHAFFLVAFTTFYGDILVEPSYVQGRTYWLSLVFSLTSLIGGIVVGLIKVWLLGNFEKRGERFRKKAIVILVGVDVLRGYDWIVIGSVLGFIVGPYQSLHPLLDNNLALLVVLGVAFNIVSYLALCGLVYLVRVRKPKTEIVESHA